MNTPAIDPADQHYAEWAGRPIVVSHWLAAICGVLVVALLAVCWALIQVQAQFVTMKPLVMKEYADGRVEVTRYDAATYRATEETVKYFLGVFMERHHRRFRSDVAREYPASLPFMSEPVKQQAAASDTDGKDVVAFTSDFSRDDVDVKVNKTAFVELQYDDDRHLIGGKASIDFEKRFLSRTRELVKTEPYVAQLHFTLPRVAPSTIVEHNPIGLQITYIRID